MLEMWTWTWAPHDVLAGLGLARAGLAAHHDRLLQLVASNLLVVLLSCRKHVRSYL